MSLLEGVGKIPTQIANMDKMNQDEMVENLPFLIASSLPLFSGIIVGAIDNQITEDFLLDECGFDDALELIEAILEVNNVAGILERIKKVQALTKR